MKAFEQALKVLEGEIKQAFPDSAVQLSLVGDQVVVRGEVEGRRRGGADPPHRRANIRRRARRTRVESRNVNVAFIPGLGDEQAAVNAIRELLEGNPNLVNLLRVPGEQQVMLMVTVAEVNRTAARSIGINFRHQARGDSEFGSSPAACSPALGQPRHDVGGNLPLSIDNGQTSHRHPGPADLELRPQPGRTEPDHAQRASRRTFRPAAPFPFPPASSLPAEPHKA